MAEHRTTRDGTVGPSTRPVAIPRAVAQLRGKHVSGVVELPAHIRWASPRRVYDLADRRDRALVYEQVLAEGTEIDLERYVELDGLIDLWRELVLPRHVRAAWDRWFAENGLVA